MPLTDITQLILKDASFRPAWAIRGSKAKGWDALTSDERRLLVLFLMHRTVTQAAAHQKLTVDEVVARGQEALRKLGFSTIGQLCEFHATQGFRAVIPIRRKRKTTASPSP